jgi:hypothetical protein
VPQTEDLILGGPPKREPPPELSPSERFSRIMNKPFKRLASLNIPPELAVESYPGRPRPHKNDFRHRLYNILRLAFLHQLSHLDRVHVIVLARLLHPRNAQKVPLTSGLTIVSLRLHGSKILAVPDQLSLLESVNLALIMAGSCQAFQLGHEDLKWMALDQVWLQCLASPELLDYVAE